jgi:hypothetical protein
MKRIAVAVAALALLGSSALVASAPAKGGKTITLLERNRTSHFRFIDNPPKTERLFHGFPAGSISPGDQLIVHIDLLNTRGKHAGWLNGSCTYPAPAHNAEKALILCHGVISLRKGSLTLEGAFRSNGDPKLAITGGRGAYTGAEGTFVSHERRGKATIDHIRLSD